MLNDFRKYNYYENTIIINALRTDAPKKAFELFSHILNAHEIWNSRIKERPAKYSLNQLHRLDDFANINEELNNETQNMLEDKNLDDVINYKNLSGKAFSNKLSDILLHLFNHGTHHRGQISMLLRQNNIAPPITDYIFYVREQF